MHKQCVAGPLSRGLESRLAIAEHNENLYTKGYGFIPESKVTTNNVSDEKLREPYMTN